MTIGSICKRNLVVAPKGESIVDAAKRMRMLHVGTVIVVEERGGRQVPAGILTDATSSSASWRPTRSICRFSASTMR
jgi:predicted transcriptional regulator